MCRWMAGFGQPVLIDELLFKTQHGIVDQSLHARMGAEPTNGDGFGLGWYGTGAGPVVYRSVSPAWSDGKLRDPVVAGLKRRPPAGPVGARRVAAVHGTCPRRNRLASAGDQLPPFPAR